ncbi:Proline-, glutamic acid-and leucine-rich protein 1 [Melia azedarach]|uniref:Proline-, glutamic acid-and leucine-rich protein 1 n=1 Tax=Melia azedarach TaxID=155640 RepID=A0ACC1YCI2_MELAZ|nr:Proline-, glutamic acid-and leucine-rich protein 1 [Melia azedarach]
MLAIDHFKNVYDIKLKPRLLRSLIKEHFPEENRPTRILAELSQIVYYVRTHKLLSESVNESTEKKVVESWKSAVDEWVDGVLCLVSSNMPDKCWTGICLLGVTCQECTFDRFSASYSVWFNKLYSHIQQQSESQFVKVASCNSMSDLITRLPSAKKDGSSLAGKLIQPLLKLLNEDGSETVWEGAVLLFCTILNSFPASVRQYLDRAEAAIASKVLSGKCSVNMMKKLVYCLSLLPKSKGDEESWWLLMQKILLLINIHLNDIFQGLEEENKGTEAITELIPPGKDCPPPLGGHTLLEDAADNATKRPARLTVSSTSMLILCCCKMLTSSSPARVAVPIRPLLDLVDRVLMVDGSVPRAMLPFMTATQQQFVCLELPVLHLYSLELLTAVIECMRSQLLPHTAYILRLVKQYFKRCALPDLRIKLYAITKSLLLSMGVGVAIHLAQEVVDNACVDLSPAAHENGRTASRPNSEAASLAPMQCSHRKRKHGATTGSSEDQNEITGLGMEDPENRLASLKSLKIAALEALETLLTVGGGSGSESWRPTVDLLLFTVATNCCKEGWGNEEKKNSFPNDPTITLADLQLAALRALLTSLLSSARVRPPYLGGALELFGKGKQAGRQLAGFCASALLALEVLIHPRFLPLERFPSANYNSLDKATLGIPEILYSGGQKQNIPYFSGMERTGDGAPDSYDDDLYDKWFSDGHGNEIPVHGTTNNVDVMNSSEVLVVQRREKLSITSSSDTEVPERNNVEQADVVMRKGVEIMVESQQVQESTVKFQEVPSSKGLTSSTVTGDIQHPEMEAELTARDGGLDGKSCEKASGEDILPERHDGLASMGGNAPTTSNTDKGKTAFDLDVDSSMDSFPDIVEVDPDSDGEESG